MASTSTGSSTVEWPFFSNESGSFIFTGTQSVKMETVRTRQSYFANSDQVNGDNEIYPFLNKESEAP